MAGELVTLRLGAVVPREALDLGFELEARGLHLTLESGLIVVKPAALLTDHDRARIRQVRDHLYNVLAEFAAYETHPAKWRLS